jgi:hypothetical protein
MNLPDWLHLRRRRSVPTTSPSYYKLGYADAIAGRDNNARTSDWGHIDRYLAGYEDGLFTLYRRARDAETPLGFAHARGKPPVNATARRV